jgi:hypothetical protein
LAVNVIGCEILLGSRVGFSMAQPVYPSTVKSWNERRRRHLYKEDFGE